MLRQIYTTENLESYKLRDVARALLNEEPSNFHPSAVF